MAFHVLKPLFICLYADILKYKVGPNFDLTI